MRADNADVEGYKKTTGMTKVDASMRERAKWMEESH